MILMFRRIRSFIRVNAMIFASAGLATMIVSHVAYSQLAENAPAPSHPASEFYAETPYRVADSFSGVSSYVRTHLWPDLLVAPFIGLGLEGISQVDAPTSADRVGSYGYLAGGLDLRYDGFRLLGEVRERRFLEKRAGYVQEHTETRLTAVYSTTLTAGSSSLFAEPYIEAVAWRHGDQHDEVADGFLRSGSRVWRQEATGLYADLLVEPYATVSAAKLPFDNRAELRLGPRLGWISGLGDAGSVGASLFAQAVAGRFLHEAPPDWAPGRYDGRSYVTQRYLFAIGGSW